MKPGDLVKIVGDTCPMYPDHTNKNWNGTSHVGYAVSGTPCVLLGSEPVDRSNNLRITFSRVLYPGLGPVWIRSTWVREVEQ